MPDQSLTHVTLAALHQTEDANRHPGRADGGVDRLRDDLSGARIEHIGAKAGERFVFVREVFRIV